jgi:hypothetical protein
MTRALRYDLGVGLLYAFVIAQLFLVGCGSGGNDAPELRAIVSEIEAEQYYLDGEEWYCASEVHVENLHSAPCAFEVYGAWGTAGYTYNFLAPGHDHYDGEGGTVGTYGGHHRYYPRSCTEVGEVSTAYIEQSCEDGYWAAAGDDPGIVQRIYDTPTASADEYEDEEHEHEGY